MAFDELATAVTEPEPDTQEPTVVEWSGDGR